MFLYINSRLKEITTDGLKKEKMEIGHLKSVVICSIKKGMDLQKTISGGLLISRIL